MGIAELILGILEQSLVLANKLTPDQATRIKSKIIQLRGDFDEEMAKGSMRDDANLDRIERELRDTGELFLTALKGQTS